MTARHCDECKHWQKDGRQVLTSMVCTKGHKPRFYVPRSDPRDTDWGWKRKCADFAPKETN